MAMLRMCISGITSSMSFLLQTEIEEVSWLLPFSEVCFTTYKASWHCELLLVQKGRLVIKSQE